MSANFNPINTDFYLRLNRVTKKTRTNGGQGRRRAENYLSRRRGASSVFPFLLFPRPITKRHNKTFIADQAREFPVQRSDQRVRQPISEPVGQQKNESFFHGAGHPARSIRRLRLREERQKENKVEGQDQEAERQELGKGRQLDFKRVRNRRRK